MNINLKYFSLLIFLAGCKENSNQAIEKDLPLFPDPITVALNTTGGYAINKITGDSIKPLINSLGDTIKTGIPIPFKGKIIDSTKTLKPKIFRVGNPPKIAIASNILPVPDNLKTIPVDTIKLKKVKFGEGKQSFVLRNSTGIVQTGIPIPITGKKFRAVNQNQ